MTKKKISAIFLILTLLLGMLPSNSLLAGSGAIFEEYAYETCHWSTTTYYMRNVKSCSTGQHIRFEVINVIQSWGSKRREYCNGGWGWCQFSDNACPPEESTEWVISETVCE